MKDQIVVVGGGIAGLETALRLERKLDREITLVEPRTQMAFYPALHKIIEGESTEKTTIDYSKKLEDRNIRHLKQEMTGLDKEENVVRLEDAEIGFESLVLAFGVETNYFGQNSEHALSLRSVDEAEEIHDKVEEGCEKAVVVGGGATGVESAASLKTAAPDLQVELVQAIDRILPHNTKSLSHKAAHILENKGVNILTGSPAEELNEEGVVLDSGREINSELVIWAAGVRKKDLIDELSLKSDRAGICVEDTMKVVDEEDIYAVGDAASYEGKENRAYFALSEAKTAAANIKADLKGGGKVENSFFWDPQVIYLGGRTSGLQMFGRSFVGFLPHIVREYFVDQRYMILRRYFL